MWSLNERVIESLIQWTVQSADLFRNDTLNMKLIPPKCDLMSESFIQLIRLEIMF